MRDATLKQLVGANRDDPDNERKYGRYLLSLTTTDRETFRADANAFLDDLPADSYRLVVGSNTQATPPCTYSLDLARAETQTFDFGTLGQSPVSISDGVPAAGAGNLETLAAEDAYRFTVSSTQSLMISGSGAPVTLNMIWRSFSAELPELIKTRRCPACAETELRRGCWPCP